MNTSKSPKQSPSKKSPRKSPTKTKKKSDVDIPPRIEDTAKFFEAGAEAFGFSDSNCHNCGIHTSEIGGFLMQCAKCKKAYYCGMKCFNEHLPKHQAYCQTAGLDKEPEKKMWEPVSPKKVKKVTLQVEEIDDNLYKLVASDSDDKPLKIKALDAAGSHLRGLEPGCLFRYTRAGTGQDSREQIQKDPERGCVHELFGKGDLKITASNEAGQKATAKVHPAEPAAPYLKVVVVDKEKRIYRVKYDDESAELEVANRGGHLYGILEPNALFCYRSNETPGERAGPDGVQILSGEDDLILTATNAAGKKTKVKVSPTDGLAPLLDIEDLGGGVHRIVASDPDGGSVVISAVDSNGHPFASSNLVPGSIFQYRDAGNGPSKDSQIIDSTHGQIPMLIGQGDLSVKATNEEKKTTEATVKPSEASPPKLEIEDLGNGLHKVVATDESGTPVRLAAVDINGKPFNLKPGSIFSYTDAGEGPSKQKEAQDQDCGNYQKLHGHGELSITATNESGKASKVTVDPSDASPPKLEIEDLGNGLRKVVATDESGTPVRLAAVDINGKPFNLTPGSIFSYTDAGEGPSKQKEAQDQDCGNYQKLHGHGELSITATNESGKASKVTVDPSDASPPKLEIEDLGNGLRKVVATDESGTPVRLAAVDINGKPFTLKPGSIFSYTDAGEGPSKQKEAQDQDCGNYQKLHGHGELSITATNESGKASKVTVDPSDASPPKLEIEDLGNGLRKVVATDDTGDPVSLRVVDGKGHTFSLEPGTIFSYIEAGNGSAKQHQVTDPSLGQFQKILGNKNLTITATNSAGKSAKADVVPVEASPPKLSVKEVKRGLFRVDASDESGEPVDVTYNDSQGNAFDSPGSFFYCTDSGEAPAHKSEKDGPEGEPVPSIFAKGNLTVTATNTAGKKTSVAVQPANASPPSLHVEEVEPGLYLLEAADEDSTEPVEIAAVDSGGKSFTSSLRPGALFRYIEAGDGACKQIELDDPDEHGKFQKLHGHGDLTITAKNAAGKTACATVHPKEASPPALVLEEIEDGMFKIVASDDNDEPLRIEAEDNLGNKFGSDFVPGNIFRYTEDDEQKDSVDDDENHGRVRNLRGPAPELWIYCYNEAGKQSKKKVKAKKRAQKGKKPRDGHDWDNEDFTLEPRDYKPKRKEERVLTKEVADKLIFWYGRLGHPNQATMRRLVATKLPPSAGITVEDVDLLPWIIRGTMLNTQKLYEVIAEMDVLEKGSYQPREGHEDSDDDC